MTGTLCAFIYMIFLRDYSTHEATRWFTRKRREEFESINVYGLLGVKGVMERFWNLVSMKVTHICECNNIIKLYAFIFFINSFYHYYQTNGWWKQFISSRQLQFFCSKASSEIFLQCFSYCGSFDLIFWLDHFYHFIILYD